MVSISPLLRAALLALAMPLMLSAQIVGGYEPRYEGSRWILGYGSYEGTEQLAINELQRMVQRYVPYVLTVLPAAQAAVQNAKTNLLLVGTAADNAALAELGRLQLIELPSLARSHMRWDASSCRLIRNCASCTLRERMRRASCTESRNLTSGSRR